MRAIWITTCLNEYLYFPGVGQAFLIERHPVEKKTGKNTTEIVCGVNSHPPDTADAARVLGFNRANWTVENGCHGTLDWNWDEYHCTIRTDHGPSNTTALRRFAIGVIKAESRDRLERSGAMAKYSQPSSVPGR